MICLSAPEKVCAIELQHGGVTGHPAEQQTAPAERAVLMIYMISSGAGL